MHTPYRGRSHTKKQNTCKSKIPIAERQARSARKKLEKLFTNYMFFQPFYTKPPTVPHPSPQAGGKGLRYQHSISITKKWIAV